MQRRRRRRLRERPPTTRHGRRTSRWRAHRGAAPGGVGLAQGAGSGGRWGAVGVVEGGLGGPRVDGVGIGGLVGVPFGGRDEVDDDGLEAGARAEACERRQVGRAARRGSSRRRRARRSGGAATQTPSANTTWPPGSTIEARKVTVAAASPTIPVAPMAIARSTDRPARSTPGASVSMSESRDITPAALAAVRASARNHGLRSKPSALTAGQRSEQADEQVGLAAAELDHPRARRRRERIHEGVKPFRADRAEDRALAVGDRREPEGVPDRRHGYRSSSSTSASPRCGRARRGPCRRGGRRSSRRSASGRRRRPGRPAWARRRSRW